MFSALSEQLCVREGASYNKVFLSSLNDPNTLSDERESSTTSPSIGDEDMDEDGSEGDLNGDDIDIGEPPIQSVVGPNGFRKFIMLLLWTVNDFNSSVKQTHLRRSTKYPSMFQCVYLLSMKSVTTRV